MVRVLLQSVQGLHRVRAHELALYAAAALVAFLLIDLFFRVFNFYGS